ncbi:MAG: hypothetical protein JWO08_1224 [Verrucomicrobiaceae bacterium]|nr:hypothetical protein [Verrucomicrobiaceae bacterium]
MDGISPTDPPDEPVNRVAGAIAKIDAQLEESEKTATFLAHLREASVSMLELYHADPKGNHREAVVRLAKKNLGRLEIFLILLRQITQNPTGGMAEAMVKMLFGDKDFATCAAIVPLIIRDLEKPDDGFWIAP